MTWRKVVWGSFIAGTYDIKVSAPGRRQIAWSRYSVFPPWHTWGTFDSDKIFGATFGCDPYCDFWFDLAPNEGYAISGHCGGCLPGVPVPFG